MNDAGPLPPQQQPDEVTISASTRLFGALLDQMSEGVVLSTEDGVIVYANRAEERLFGYRPGELIGRHVSIQSAYPEEEDRRRAEAMAAALDEKGHWRGEWLNRRKDGTTFVSHSRISRIEMGGRAHLLYVQEDVTQESGAAAALRDSEARLELATAAAGIGIWDWNLLSGEMIYSPRAKAICGFAPDADVTYDMVRDATHPDDYPRTSRMAQRALDPALRERVPYEYRIVRPDGEVRWVVAHGEAVFGAIEGEQRPLRYVGTLQDVTERRRLEEARAASERRLALAIAAGRMAVWEVDVVEDRLIGSPELNRLLGYPEDAELDIDEVRSRYYPGERERLQKLGEEVLGRGERFLEAEYRYYRPDGALRWMMLRAEMQYGASGAPERAVGVLIDVTRAKETEQALRTGEARLQIALRAAGAGVFEWDVATGRLQWSPELYGLYGLDPERVEDLHQAWLAAVHPEDVEMAQTIGARAAETGEPFTVDFRIRRADDGETRWLRAYATVVAGPDGRPEKVTGINSDVTAEHRSQESLRSRAEETERERDRIYELSNDLFGVAGFDGYLKVVNPAWQRRLGYRTAELLGEPFIDRIHPDDRALTAETVGLLRHGRDIRRFENRLLAADGSLVWMSWSAVAEGDHFYVVGRDVTGEREREEALRQAQKMEAIGHLTGGIAHDFNNLLQAVHGNFDLIRRRGGDERLVRWAEQGLKAAERGSRLTSQLLAFSRAQKLELRPIDAHKRIGEMRELLARTLGPMIRIEVALEADKAIVLGDETQLEMALLNLAINARDAMPEGGTLSIRTAGETVAGGELAAGDYLRIEIADTGTGMDAATLARAFDPFFTTKGVGKGTGLGLSQVYGMARQAGGTARVESAPGRGTTVSLLLRRTDRAPGDEAAGRSRVSAGGSASATVMVVDDDGDVRRFLADTLGDLGYAVVEAEDGASALAAVERAPPDLMIVDFAMPGMTGAELADRLRADRPSIPIIFASGYADTAAIEAAVGREATLLRKPFRIDELAAAAAAALSR